MHVRNLSIPLVVSVVLLATLAGSIFADSVIQNGGFEAGLDGWQTDFEGRVGTDVAVEVIDVTARWGMSRPAGPNCAFLQRYEWYEWPPGATQYPTKAEISQAIYVPESAQSLKFDVAAMASAVPLTYHTFFEVVFQDQERSSQQLYYIYWDLLDWIPLGPLPFNWYTDFMSEEIDISMYAGQSGYLIFRMRELSGPQFIQFIGVLVDDARVEIVPPPPTLISPANGSNVSGTSVQFCWNAATGANNYHLQIATDPSFNDIVYDFDVGNITCNVEVSSFPDDGTTFYWHVKAGSAADWSNYSEAWSFVNGPSSIPDPPILSSPTNGSNAAGTTVQFGWNASPRANNYYLQVATDSQFNNTVFDEEIGNYVSVNMSGFPDNGTTFYWRVKAGNVLGWSSYSEIWSFVNGPSSIPDAPILSSPANGSNVAGTTVQFRWNASPRANNYHLQVATDSGFNNTVFDGEIGYYVGADVPGFPDDGTRFYWRVKAGNALGWSSYSDTWYFDNGTTPAPEPATNPNPADGATGVGINADLTWAAGTGATSHDVYFGTSITPAFVHNQTSTTYDPGTLANDTTYYWRIDEVGTGGTTTGIIWSFTTQVEPDPDLNSDGIVNFSDFAVLAWHWMGTCFEPDWCEGADFDRNEHVDFTDVCYLVDNWLGGAGKLLFFDDFENIAVGDYSDENDWQNMFSGVTAYITDEQAYGGNKSFRLEGYSNWSRHDYVNLSPLPAKVIYEACIKLTDSAKGAGVGFLEKFANMGPKFNAVVFWSDNRVLFYGPDGDVLLESWNMNKWYKVHVEIDFVDETADVTIINLASNDTFLWENLRAYPIEFTDPGYGSVTLDNFGVFTENFGSGLGGTDLVYFDDVKVEEAAGI